MSTARAASVSENSSSALACPRSSTASVWNRLQKWYRRPETTHTSFSRTYKGVTNEHDRTTQADRHRPAVLRQVPVSADQEELWQVEVPREPGARRSLPRGGVRRPSLLGPRRHAAADQHPDLAPFRGSGGQVLRRLPPLHQPQQH